MAIFGNEKHDVSPEPEREYSQERGPDGEPLYDDDLHVPCPSHTTELKLMAKIDYRVMPWICILYLMAFLDRINIANANSFKLSQDLHLVGTQYNTALVIFFVPYTLFEIPSNILLKKFTPRIWLSFCMFFFGLTTVCQGLTKSYGGLLAARFFLGAFEAGMFPGCFYLMSFWYKRSEAQRRYSFFFSSTTLAGAFGGLLASAIGKMQGDRGYNGWRWLFIIEGTATCVIGLILFFLLPNFPEESKWLNTEERAYVKARLRADQGRSARERKITVRDVLHFFTDFKVYLGALMYFGMIVPAYGYAYFSVPIIRSYGYSPIETQLHSVPPYATAFGFCMLLAYLSDKSRHRWAYALFAQIVAIIGFAILLSDTITNRHVKYMALFFIVSGTYTAMPIIVCWFSQNLGGHHRRAIGTAWQIGFGNTGGIISVFAFLPKNAPRYLPGNSICISFICLSFVSCCAYGVSCAMQNRNRDKAPRDLGLTEYEKTEKGDMSPDYRYQL